MPAELLIVGTRMHYGVAGCMCDELRARGQKVGFIELYPDWSRSIAHRVLARLLPGVTPQVMRANRHIARAIADDAVRFVIVTNGRELDPDVISQARQSLARRGGGIACFLCDDPFNPVHRCASWLRALAEYTVVVSTKRQVVPDLVAVGCRHVQYARFGYHPPIHRPVDPQAMGFVRCDIGFAGTADADRLPILGGLAEGTSDLSFNLYGHRWSAHPALREIAQPPVTGLQYSAAMRAATVCPCLVRRANRDGHVMRSIELPAIGAFMLAERTEEHQEMFDEGVHCDYWGSVEELIDKSRWYSSNPRRAACIAHTGHAHVIAAPNTYADRALEIVQMLCSAPM
jgi:hypothetical protein